MVIGYARVSTELQSLDRQLDALKSAGAEKIFKEKVTGTKRNRTELDKMLNSLESGDIVIVADLTRLSRSTKDLFEIIDTIHNKGAEVKSLKETWLDTTTPQGKLLFTIFAGLSQFERDLTADRTKERLIKCQEKRKETG